MKKWILKPVDEEQVKKLAVELELAKNKPASSPERILQLLSRLFVIRGLDTIEKVKKFINPDINQTHNPFLMKGMDLAVDRILKAITDNQKIMVYGDYDVDGTTSVSLMMSYLSAYTTNLVQYIPDRHKEGYGISLLGIDFAEKEGAPLIIALDCGIKALKQVDYAAKKGIEFIICDHHLPGDKTPEAVAVLDPLQADCKYPYKSLSGCAIGYKLAEAIESKVPNPKVDVRSLLDLVAISLACDIVPLTGENRILIHYGIEKIKKSPRPGVKLLLQAVENRPVTVTDLVFKAGPVINSAGRMKHGSLAVALLTEPNEEKAKIIYKQISEQNQNRKEEDKTTTVEALAQIRNDAAYESANSSVLYHSEWHKGVIGIVASRVIESYYRPTIILTESNGKATGSARSIKGINIYEALEQCSEHLIQFGGHKYAAGLTLELENIEAFRRAFEKAITTMKGDDDFIPEIVLDAELKLGDISRKFYDGLNRLAPFGPSNMKPVFVTRGVVDAGYTRAVGTDKDHLKLNIVDPDTGTVMNGIAFGMGAHADEISSGKPFDIVYTIEINSWNNQENIELGVKDLSF